MASPTIIVTEVSPDPIIIEVAGTGIQGVPGIQGIPGAAGVGASLPPGNITGDFIRWNANTNVWEVKSEPIELEQLVLTPLANPAVNKEGSMWYNGNTKSILVCTSDV